MFLDCCGVGTGQSEIMVVVTEIEIDDDVDWVMMLGTGLDCDTRQGIFLPQLLDYYHYSQTWTWLES